MLRMALLPLAGAFPPFGIQESFAIQVSPNHFIIGRIRSENEDRTSGLLHELVMAGVLNAV